MNRWQRYMAGTMLVVFAGVLGYLGEPVWAALPAVASVYMLGGLLWDVWKDQ
jgi:hypothetical protein